MREWFELFNLGLGMSNEPDGKDRSFLPLCYQRRASQSVDIWRSMNVSFLFELDFIRKGR